MRILLATGNPKKREEMQRILSPLGIQIATPDEIGVSFEDVEETGTTFYENARIKAVAGVERSNLPCIADDSGLSVDALQGEPGVYSARYAGGHGNDEQNIQKVLEKLKDVPMEERTAQFTCSVCCLFPDGKEVAVEGTCEGKIGTEPLGNGGFGYDPIFLYEGKSFATVTPEEKDRVSHRGSALRALQEQLKEYSEKE